jgi:MFS family permease
MASGYASDAWRKRKALVLIGYGLSALTKPFLYFANSWGSVLGLRFTDRVGKGVRTSPRDALLAASTPAASRGLAFGFHRGADTAGAFLGLLAVAAIIYLSQGWAAQLHEAAFRRLVLAAVVPGLAAVAVLCAVRELPPARVRPAAQRDARPRLDRRFKFFLGAAALFGLANSSDAFLLLRAQNLGLSLAGIALLLSGFNLCYSLLSPVGGRWSDRWGRPVVIGAGWSLYVLSYLGFGLAREPWHIWTLFAVYAVYYGLAEGTARALVADLVPDEQRGTAYGLYNTVVGATALPASLLAGLVWQGAGLWAGWGPGAPFLLGAAFAGIALTLLAVSMRGLRRPAA